MLDNEFKEKLKGITNRNALVPAPEVVKPLPEEPVPDSLYFAVPLFFNDEYIDFILDLNQRVSKNRIFHVYNSLPIGASGGSGFEHGRSFNRESKQKGENFNSLETIAPYIQRVQREGLVFSYNLNNFATKSGSQFQQMIPRIQTFLSQLLELNVHHISVANQMLAGFIKDNFPQFKVTASTIMDVTSITKARGLIDMFNLKGIVPSTDLNKDFDFIDGFAQLFPNVSLVLMADEGCIFGCPTKNIHYSIFGAMNQGPCMPILQQFPKNICAAITRVNPALQITKNKLIYPWDIPLLEKHGVTAIKLVGRDQEMHRVMDKIAAYVLGQEDPEFALNQPYHVYNTRFAPFTPPPGSPAPVRQGQPYQYGDILMKDLINYLPQIDYCEKTRTNCRSACELKCHYCYTLADKIIAQFSKT